jgi:hypothetical protein
MRRILLIAAAVIVALPLTVETQTTASGGWTPPRTFDGRPDLQGIWTTQTYTPLQRPERYAGREFLTDEEFEELVRLVTQEGVDPLAGGVLAASDEERETRIRQNDPTHYNNDVWLRTPQPKTLSSRRTSLIFDPPTGRIPALTPEGQRRAAARRAAMGFDSYENRPLQERCVVWTHEGPPMLPPPYNDVFRIVQTPGQVVIFRELSTNLPRIIPTDGRPHVSEKIRQWAGDSRGRWEGDTLVVETTNFNDKTAFQGSTSGLHVTERFTRVSEDQIVYRFTVHDPATWTAPWSAEIPMLRTEGEPYEYTCHEGNYGIVNILRGARAADAKAGVTGQR